MIESFDQCKELSDHFEWTEELISLEKHCLSLFFENIFNKYKEPDSIRVEDLLKEEYFNYDSYSQLQELYEKELEKANVNENSKISKHKIIMGNQVNQKKMTLLLIK